MTDQPPPLKPCPECGGERLPTELRGYARLADYLVAQNESTLREKHRSGLRTMTCKICGYTSLYATEPAKLEP